MGHLNRRKATHSSLKYLPQKTLHKLAVTAASTPVEGILHSISVTTAALDSAISAAAATPTTTTPNCEEEDKATSHESLEDRYKHILERGIDMCSEVVCLIDPATVQFHFRRPRVDEIEERNNTATTTMAALNAEFARLEKCLFDVLVGLDKLIAEGPGRFGFSELAVDMRETFVDMHTTCRNHRALVEAEAKANTTKGELLQPTTTTTATELRKVEEVEEEEEGELESRPVRPR